MTLFCFACDNVELSSLLFLWPFELFFFADDPHNDPNISGDPYKTLFVARLVSTSFDRLVYTKFFPG